MMDAPMADSTLTLETVGLEKTSEPESFADMVIRNPGGRLGEILIEEKAVTRRQLDLALHEQKRTGDFLGKTLISLGMMDEDALSGFLMKQCRIPYLNIAYYTIDESLTKRISREMCEAYHLLPVDLMAQMLTVAMVNPMDDDALEALHTVCPGYSIKPVLCSIYQFDETLRRLYYGEGEIRQQPITYDVEPDINEHVAVVAAPKRRRRRRNRTLESILAVAACLAVVCLSVQTVITATSSAPAPRQDVAAAPAPPAWAGRLSPADQARRLIHEYEERLKNDPDLEEAPSVIFAIGNLYRQKLGDHEEAAQQYMRILEEYPRWEGARMVYSQLETTFETLNDELGMRWLHQLMLDQHPENTREHVYAAPRIDR